MKGLLFAATLFSAPALARPPAPGSEDAAIMHDFVEWITTQSSSTGQYCCDLSDGRPLHADEIRVIDGHYQVLYTKRHWDNGTEQWLQVPKEAILPQLSPVGYPIVWILNAHVYCFALSGAT